MNNNAFENNLEDNEEKRDSMLQSFVMRPEETKDSQDKSIPLPERILNDADARKIR